MDQKELIYRVCIFLKNRFSYSMSTNWAVVFFISLRIFCIVSFCTTFELSVPSLARTTQFNTANKQRSKMPNYTVAKVLYVGFFHHLNKSRNFQQFLWQAMIKSTKLYSCKSVEKSSNFSQYFTSVTFFIWTNQSTFYIFCYKQLFHHQEGF